MATIQELTASMLAGNMTQEEFTAAVMKAAGDQNAKTANNRRPFKVNVSKTGGMTVPSRKLGAGTYPVWGYASQWVALLANAPELIEAIFSRANGPLPGDNGVLSVYVPGVDGESGTSRPIKPDDLPAKDAYIRCLIEKLSAMLPATVPTVPAVNPTPTVPVQPTTEETESEESEPVEKVEKPSRRRAA